MTLESTSTDNTRSTPDQRVNDRTLAFPIRLAELTEDGLARIASACLGELRRRRGPRIAGLTT